MIAFAFAMVTSDIARFDTWIIGWPGLLPTRSLRAFVPLMLLYSLRPFQFEEQMQR